MVVIESRTTGYREVLNTRWPIETVVERLPGRKRPTWQVTFGICNGVADGSRRYATKREALASVAVEQRGQRDA